MKKTIIIAAQSWAIACGIVYGAVLVAMAALDILWVIPFLWWLGVIAAVLSFPIIVAVEAAVEAWDSRHDG